MKKRYLLIWIALLLSAALLLAGCRKNTENADAQTEEDDPLSDGSDDTPTYRIDFGGRNSMFIDAPERCAAGDEVVLKTYIVMDATPVVTVDGERLSPDVSDDYRYLLYTFIMPAHDVEVTYSISGSDMIRQFSIAYEGDTLRVIDPVYRATPHDIVTVKLGMIFDVVTEVRVNGKNAEQVDGPDSGYLYFEFEMPEEDVTVEIASNNISVVDGEPIIMVDYYETAVAAVGDDGAENGYYELVLYDDQNGDLLLVEYRNGGTPQETETRYRVPMSVLTDALDVIYDARMNEWNGMTDTISADGALYVCSYNDSGSYTRVTSEQMPADGMEAFSALRSLLSAYLADAYRE